MYAPRVWIFRARCGKTPGNRWPAPSQRVDPAIDAASSVGHRSGATLQAVPAGQPNPWRTVHAFCHRLHRRLRPRHRGGLRDRPGRPDHGRGQTEGLRPVWRQHRACGLLQSRRRRQLVGHRRRRLPRRRCGGVRRCQGGQVHAAHRQGAVHRRAVRRGRRAVAQHHLDPQSRQRAGARFRRRDLLRRPGLHGAQVARASRARSSWTAPRCACRPAPRPSSTSPTTSAPTTCRTRRWCSSAATRRAPPTSKAAATRSPPTSRACTPSASASANPDDHIVLPEVISKEPLGPVVRHGDNAVGRRRPLDALRHGRGRGARRHLAERRRHEGQLDQPGGPPAAGRRGRHGRRGSACPTTGATRSIKQVGNYGEIFERNIGMSTPLKIERGLNAQWTNGGLQYAMPVR